MPRSLIVVLGVLLALCSAFTTVIGQATLATANELGSPAKSGVKHTRLVGVAPRAQLGEPRALYCNAGERQPERLQKLHRAPAQQDHATPRRAGGDQLEWMRPGLDLLPVPSRVSAKIWGPAEAALQHRLHRTCDSRAPPAS